jgi:hypothetical protein
MSSVDHSIATLRLFGDELVPEEITAMLGASPSEAYKKGQEIIAPSTGNVRIAKRGSWRLRAARREPEDLETQIFEVLAQLSNDLALWQSLSRYEPHFFCGLFMSSPNDGMALSPKVLLALGERGIGLGLDIYDADDQVSGNGP